MTNVGWATLDVIPTFKGLQGQLEKGTLAPMAAAGKSSGQKFGDAAGRTAGSRFKSRFAEGVKGFAAPLAGVAIGAGVVDFFHDAFAEAKEAGKVSRVTAKLIETTGQAAGVTADQVGALAGKLMDYAAVDDEVIQSGENVLLTFRNVRNEIGGGNAIFDRASKAGLDLAAVLGSDLNGAALQLGKALNDPLKGMTALGRAGVQFNESQKAQIKAMVEAGDLLSAQKVILTEVEKQVGGAAGAAADGTDRLHVAIGNLKEAVGIELMPAVEAFSNWAVDDGIPAISAAGGAVGDLIGFVNDIPAPIKAATAAWGAYTIAQRIGLNTSIASGATRIGSAIDGIRLRLMLAGDEYKRLSRGTIELNGNFGKVTPGVNRFSSSLGALRVGAAGAGTALKSGLGGAVSLLGGPWGVALAAGTAAVTYFWQEHQKARAFVDELTESLDKQTGALTENSSETIFKSLQDSGAIEAAKELGINLFDLQQAAEGNEAAIARVSDRLQDFADVSHSLMGGRSVPDPFHFRDIFSDDNTERANKIREALGDVTGALREGRTTTEDYAEATGTSAHATETATRAIADYATKLENARDKVQKLLDAENKRRENALQDRRDRIALLDTLAASRKEAREGKRTLDENTQAGRDNMSQLLDLADQWNNTTPKVRNARGEYDKMRKAFIDLADEMNGPNGTRAQAKALADELLRLPRNKAITIDTPGMDKALAKLERLHALASLRDANRIRVTVGADQALATGGLVGGYGNGTSDSNLIWASRGEFMQRKAAVDYYGVEFMRKLNSLQIPKYAQGGSIGASSQRPVVTGGTVINVGQVVAHDYDDFTRQMQARQRRQAIGGVPIGRR